MKVLTKIASVFLMPLLLVSATNGAATDTCPLDGVWEQANFPPWSGENYIYSFKFKAPVDLHFGYALYISNPLFPSSTYGTRGKMVIDRLNLNSFVEEGGFMTCSGMVMAKYLSKQDNYAQLYIKTSYEGGECNWRVPFRIEYASEREFILSPGKSCVALETSGMKARDGNLYAAPYRLENRNLQSTYVNPSFSMLPLKDMQFREVAYGLDFMPFDAKTISLQIYNHFSDFPCLSTSFYNGKECLQIPLETTSAGLGVYSCLRTKYAFAVSKDGREMRTYQERKPNDVLIQSIIFPPVKNGESKTYDCEITASGCGELDRWSFTYSFDVVIDQNYFGSCQNAEWCVEEILP